MTKAMLPILVAVFFPAFNFFQQYAVICFLIFCVGLIAGALYPVALALIGEIVPLEKMGTANAPFSFACGLGCVVGPAVTGWILKLYSISFMFYPMALAALVFVLTTFFRTNANRNPEPPG